jgi:hypothetical protein
MMESHGGHGNGKDTTELTIPIRTQRGCGERYEHGFTVLYMKDET